MDPGKELERVVYGYWAQRFWCAIEDFGHSGTRIIRGDELAGTCTVYVCRIDRMSVVQVAPTLAERLGLADGRVLDSTPLTVNGLRSRVGARLEVEVGRTLIDAYLYPRDFAFLVVLECLPASAAARRFLDRVLPPDLLLPS
jgi:hypothetical protein